MAKILIIDDDNAIRELYRYILTDLGYEVETAVDGRDALAKVREFMPDCMLLDICMPEMSGAEFAQELRHNPDPALRNIPFLVLTGERTTDLARQYDFSDNTSCKAFLPRMSCPDSVAEKVQEVLLYSER